MFKQTLRKLIYIVLILVFIVLLAMELFAKINGLFFSVATFIYWDIFLFWVVLTTFKKVSIEKNILVALSFFVSGAIGTLLYTGFGEIILKLSLMGWIISVSQIFLFHTRHKE